MEKLMVTKDVYRMLLAFVVWALVSGLQGEFWTIWTWFDGLAASVMAWIVAGVLAIGAINWVMENWGKE